MASSVSASSVAYGSVAERDSMRKSAIRSFTVTVRAPRPSLRSLRCDSAAARSNAASTSGGVVRSCGYVCSEEICFDSALGATGRSSTPRANHHSCLPTAPPMAMSSSFSLRLARSPIVSIPAASSFDSVTGPTPHSSLTGIGCKISSCRSCGMTNTPSGFARPEPIFAYCFPGPAPIELGKPVSSLMAARSSFDHCSTSSGLAPTKSSGSMNASSMDSCSTTPTCLPITSNTRRDAAT